MSPETSRLKNLPISWFAAVMGLSGFAIAWMRAEHIFALDLSISPWLTGLAALVFVTISGLYLSKFLKYRGDVLAEMKHPVKLAFVPTFSIGLLLLSIAFLPTAETLSFWLWSIGTALHLVITLFVLSSWIQHSKYEITHLNPAWFIPVVGNILVPIAGLHHAPADISWFFFSLGVFFWPVLTAILFYRLIFHPSLPERLIPTLFIFIAPPAVGFISWYNLVGEIDAFAKVLYFVGLFFTLLLLAQFTYFARLKFFLSWWAYSFPIAAITIATLVMFKETGDAFYSGLAIALLALLSALIALLIGRTGLAIWRREICIEGH